MNISQEWLKNEFANHEAIEEHMAIEEELKFYTAISSGDISFVEENCRQRNFANPDGKGILSDNPVQNMRYHFVTTTAIVIRYCIYAGMEHERAYSLSDFYITKMDKCKTVDEIVDLHDIMCLELVRQMNQLRNKQATSRHIVLCMDYIYSHVHNRITVSELAEHLNLSESYLSKLFMKEVGISISQYIQNLKLENAKNLLQYSSYSIADIANFLSFSSQSHFIQTFQKATGMTPNKYRAQYFRAPKTSMN